MTKHNSKQLSALPEAASHQNVIMHDAVVHGVVIHGADGSVISCNAAAQNILAVPADMFCAAVEGIFQQAICTDKTLFVASEHPIFKTLRTGQAQAPVPVGLYRPDGEIVWVLMATQPLFENDFDSSVDDSVDDSKTNHRSSLSISVISAFFEIEENLVPTSPTSASEPASTQEKNQKKTLVPEQNNILALKKEAPPSAEEPPSAEDDFLSILGHELRRPLNPILGYSRLLQARDLSEERTISALEIIERNAKLQSQLIDHLLDIAKSLDRQRGLKSSPTELSKVMRSASDALKVRQSELPLPAGITTEQPAEVATAHLLAGSLKGVRVLAVDDHEDSILLTEMALREYGATVKTATKAAAAISLLTSYQPDVLILDIGLPDINGYRLLPLIRHQCRALETLRETLSETLRGTLAKGTLAKGPLKKRFLENSSNEAVGSVETAGVIPAIASWEAPAAIALTAYAQEKDKQKALKAGFQVHLVKPVDIYNLVQTVAALANPK